MSFVAKELKRLAGKAIHQHQMIKDGDHVLVAVSGGKDSMVLLWLLRERIRRIPIEYQITAVHIDPGFGFNSGSQMESFFIHHGFKYKVLRTDIGLKAHGPENKENPCFLCSRLRRKLLFQLASDFRCNKIAFGHNKDDLIETLFLNIFYGASISTMLPVQQLFNGTLSIIRPLYLLDENVVQRYADYMELPIIDLGCPSSVSTKREEIKTMLKIFYRSNKKIKGNIFHALKNVNTDYLL